MVWDRGSGKNLFRIPDLGVKKAPDPGSGSAKLRSSVKYHSIFTSYYRYVSLEEFKKIYATVFHLFQISITRMERQLRFSL